MYHNAAKSRRDFPDAVAVVVPDDARRYFAELDVFIMDELSVTVGFMPGTYTLARHGVRRIGDLVGKTEAELLAIRGIGPRRVAHLQAYLAARGMRLGTPCRAWIEGQRHAAIVRPTDCLN